MKRDARHWLLTAVSDADLYARFAWVQRKHGVEFCTDGFRIHMMASLDGGVNPATVFMQRGETKAQCVFVAGDATAAIGEAVKGLRRPAPKGKTDPMVMLALPSSENVALNAWYLLDALTGLPEDRQVMVSWAGSEQPVLISATDRAAMIMPLSIGNLVADGKGKGMREQADAQRSSERMGFCVLREGQNVGGSFPAMSGSLPDVYDPMATLRNPPAETDREKELAGSVAELTGQVEAAMRHVANAVQDAQREARRGREEYQRYTILRDYLIAQGADVTAILAAGRKGVEDV